MEVSDGKPHRLRVEGPVRIVFEAWSTNVGSSLQNVGLIIDGVHEVMKRPTLYEILNDAKGEGKPLDVERARRQADYAAKEASEGFPVVHAQSLLATWGAFESLIEDLCVALLEAHPSLLGSDCFDRVKMPVSSLAGGPSEEWYRSVMLEATRTLASPLAVGVTKFEGPLGLVGMAGPVPEAIRTGLFVAQQVRNVWAHRAGVADGRFVEKCPSFGVAKGERVALDHETYTQLVGALQAYAFLLVHRYRARFLGAALSKVKDPDGFEGAFDGFDFLQGGRTGRQALNLN